MDVKDADDVLVDVAADLEAAVAAVRGGRQGEAVGAHAAAAVDAVDVDLALLYVLVRLARPEEVGAQELLQPCRPLVLPSPPPPLVLGFARLVRRATLVVEIQKPRPLWRSRLYEILLKTVRNLR